MYAYNVRMVYLKIMEYAKISTVIHSVPPTNVKNAEKGSSYRRQADVSCSTQHSAP